MEKQAGINKKYFKFFLIIWVVQMAAAFYFCTQKQGFHEDEYYTYYSTARTNGFYVEDGQWMERETYRDEFVVLPKQRFQYGLVRLVQSWDVHPPMYYWVFHTVASLVPGVFSKWIGLSVNLFFHGMNIILLTYLSYLVSGKDVRMPLLVNVVYGLSPAAMSGVVFIRMYEMLTFFVLLCAILHIRAMEQRERKLPVLSCLLPMAAVTYFGFLTQYYYFIFLFFLAAGFGVWLLWRDRHIWNCLRYGVSQGIAFALAYLTYPAFPGQMFHGQRGAQATENFFDLSNTFERLWFFLDLMNGYVFGYSFFVLLLVIVLLAVACRRRKEEGYWEERRNTAATPEITAAAEIQQTKDADCYGNGTRFGIAYFLLLGAAAGYFVAVSKTALLLGETSNRYELPIYGIVVLLLLLAVRTMWRRTVSAYAMRRSRREENTEAHTEDTARHGLYKLIPSAVKVLLLIGEFFGDLCLFVLAYAIKYRKYTEKAAFLFCLVIVLAGHVREDVVFLYPEDKTQTAYAKARAAEGTPAVYLYRQGEEWCIWDVTNELLAYPGIYFAAADGTDTIRDERIRDAAAWVVYLPKEADAPAQLARLCDGNAAWADCQYQRVFEEKYCDVYYVVR